MDVRLLYFEDCPNWQLAESRLREALAELGDDRTVITRELVTTPEEAERAHFRGSPTILIAGRDPFASADDPVGLACRLYAGPAGTEHSPTVDQLRSALSDAR